MPIPGKLDGDYRSFFSKNKGVAMEEAEQCHPGGILQQENSQLQVATAEGFLPFFDIIQYCLILNCNCKYTLRGSTA